MTTMQPDLKEDSHAEEAALTSAQQTLLIYADIHAQLLECQEIIKRIEYHLARTPALPIPLSTHVLPFFKRMTRGTSPKKRKRAGLWRALL